MVKYLDNNSGFNQWNAARATDNNKSRFSVVGFLKWFFIILAAWWLVGIFMTPRSENNTAEPVANTSVDITGVPTSVVTSDKITATVQGLRISDIKLADFMETNDNSEKVSLLAGDGDYSEFGYMATGTTAPLANTVWANNDGKMTWRNSDGVSFTRTITISDYVIIISDEIKNTASRDVAFAPYARIVRGNDMKSSAGVYSGAIAYVNSKLNHKDWRSLDRNTLTYSTTNGYAGFADQYWETFASISAPDQTIRIRKIGEKYQSDVASAAVTVPSGGNATITTYLFAGPRSSDALNAAQTYIPHAAKTIDYGWFWFLVMPMMWLLRLLHAFVLNYGVAIILLTIILRGLLWPLTRKSFKSSIAMQKMQPEMERIQKLYGNDKARMSMEMMKLYQTNKMSPMSGCLPMLIQIPIFFALYKALLISVPLRNAQFLWIHDLAAMDPYFILPILMGLTMWIQQRLSTPNMSNNPMMKTMMWMPLIFTVMFAWMPAGLVLYWTTSNIFGLVQLYIIRHTSDK